MEAAVRNADVIVTATEPLLKGSWLKEGALVVAVGAPRPTWRELYDDVMTSGVLVVDFREAVLKELGDVILSKTPIYAEVGEICIGAKPKPPPGSTTVFTSRSRTSRPQGSYTKP